MAGYSASYSDASSSQAAGSADRTGNTSQRIGGLTIGGSRPVPEFPFGNGSRASTVSGGVGSLVESPALQWAAVIGLLVAGLFVMRRK